MRASTEDFEMRVCAALITENINELRRLSQNLEFSRLSNQFRTEVESVMSRPGIDRTPWYVQLTYRLPPLAQLIGQRAALLFPRLAHRLIRASRVHQQWY
jgi:hypothetical protein